MKLRAILSAAAVAVALSVAPSTGGGGSSHVALPDLDELDPFPVGACIRAGDLDPRPICILIDPDHV